MNVQTAMEIAAARGYENNTQDAWSDADAVVAGLRGKVRLAYESPFANFVLSRIFEVMPTHVVSCLAKELRGLAVDAAQHRFGCRCIIRLVRYHARQIEDEHVSAVINELLAAAAKLGRTQFGTHVVQEVLESGLPEHRAAVARHLRGKLLHESMNRFAGRAVEKAIAKCCHSDVNKMMDELLSCKEGVYQLVNNEFGTRVVKVLIGGEIGEQRGSGPPWRHAKRAAEMLCKFPSEVESSRSGRPLLHHARVILTNSGCNVAWH
jgi:hypothetical protein